MDLQWLSCHVCVCASCLKPLSFFSGRGRRRWWPTQNAEISQSGAVLVIGNDGGSTRHGSGQSAAWYCGPRPGTGRRCILSLSLFSAFVSSSSVKVKPNHVLISIPEHIRLF
ncbi:hypothetical protein CEXT_628931 [Caerostris extrusa]|uniref:Secreted protein n=1 Tax=Caerostris extrusa TaxID=172846 RepID=A0AAV4X5S2_CAEEX|nr:hypothetical protein CEXT_628931 [Caerostris extrusa]